MVNMAGISASLAVLYGAGRGRSRSPSGESLQKSSRGARSEAERGAVGAVESSRIAGADGAAVPRRLSVRQNHSSRVEGRATPQRAAVIETNAARQSIAGQGMAEHRPHEDWAVLGGSSLVWAASDVGTTAVRAVTAVAAVACDA